MARKSEHCKSRRNRTSRFVPEIDEWREACRNLPFDQQIIRHFGICHETFYAFLDKEYYRQEQEEGYISDFVASYKQERLRSKNKISEAYFKLIDKGDTPSIIFGMKSFNGLLEARDIEHIELKKKQMAIRANEFLLDLAAKFKLDEKELKAFVKKYHEDFDR